MTPTRTGMALEAIKKYGPIALDYAKRAGLTAPDFLRACGLIIFSAGAGVAGAAIVLIVSDAV